MESLAENEMEMYMAHFLWNKSHSIVRDVFLLMIQQKKSCDKDQTAISNYTCVQCITKFTRN